MIVGGELPQFDGGSGDDGVAGIGDDALDGCVALGKSRDDEGEAEENSHKKGTYNRRTMNRESQHGFLLSRLAGEVKVVPRSRQGRFAGCKLRRSPGLAA